MRYLPQIADDSLARRALDRYQAEGGSGLRRALGWRVAKHVKPTRQRLGSWLVGPPPAPDPTPMDGVLRWLAGRDGFTVVQIGAFVGDSASDPLYGFLRTELPGRPERAAVLVEPVREYFDALQLAYAGVPTVRIENVAIAEEAGERNFYRPDRDSDPADYGLDDEVNQLGSLRPDFGDSFDANPAVRDFWQKHRTVETVQCWTFEQLLERHDIEQVDLLQVDTEGYDYEILRTVDFSRVRPRFINYERVHLHDDEQTCRSMLNDAGYVLFDWDLDTLAVALAA